HLAIVRGKVIYSPKNQGRADPDVWPAWLHRPTEHALSLISVVSYVLAWIAGACAFVTRRTGVILLAVALALITVGSGIGLWDEQSQADLERQTPVVVLLDNTDFYRGNAASYPKHADVPFLPRGLEARQVHRRGGWLQIRLTTGEVGWVPA